MENLHFYYDQLTPIEKEALDRCFVKFGEALKEEGFTLDWGDGAERAVNAAAKWIIES